MEDAIPVSVLAMELRLSCTNPSIGQLINDKERKNQYAFDKISLSFSEYFSCVGLLSLIIVFIILVMYSINYDILISQYISSNTLRENKIPGKPN